MGLKYLRKMEARATPPIRVPSRGSGRGRLAISRALSRTESTLARGVKESKTTRDRLSRSILAQMIDLTAISAGHNLKWFNHNTARKNEDTHQAADLCRKLVRAPF